MPKLSSIVIWVALLVPSAAHAQGEWLQKGVSGVAAQALVTHEPNANVFGLTAGYSYQGYLDANLTLAWIDTTIPNVPDVSEYSLGAQLVYHPLKQTKEVPVSIKVGIGYAQTFVSSSTLSDNQESVSAWSTTLSGGAYRFFPVAERLGVTPQIQLGWTHSSLTDSIPGESQTSTGDNFGVALSAALAYLDSAGHIWGVAPALSFGPGDTPTVISLSVAFISTIPGAR